MSKKEAYFVRMKFVDEVTNGVDHVPHGVYASGFEEAARLALGFYSTIPTSIEVYRATDAVIFEPKTILVMK